MKTKSLFFCGLFSMLFLSPFFLKAQVKQRCSVGFLIDKKSQQNSFIYSSVKEEVQRIIGEEASIVFDTTKILVNDYDETLASKNYLALQSDPSVDIILSQGGISNYIVETSDAPNKPTIMIGQVMEEVSSTLWKDNRKNNVCYVVSPFSVKEDLTLFKELVSYKKVAVLMNPRVLNIFPVENFLDGALDNENVDYKIVPLTVDMNYEEQLKDVDAVYFLISEEYPKADLEKIIQNINDLKLRSFTSTLYDASDLGVLFAKGNADNEAQLIRRVALNIESIQSGVEASTLTSKMVLNKELNFNIQTSYKIGFNPKYSQLFQLKITGDVLDYKAAKVYDLKDVLEQVVEKNYKLKAEKQKVEISKEDTKIAKSSYLPKVTASGSAMNLDPAIAEALGQNSKSINSSVKATVEQVLYSQEASSNIKIKKYQEKASEAQFSSQTLNMLNDCGMAYYQALIAKTNYKIADENLNLTRKNYTISENNFSAGESGKADVLRWKSELANATQMLINSYFSLKSSMYQLNQMLGNPVGTSIDIISPEMDKVLLKENYFKPIFDIIDDPTQREKVVQIISQISIDVSPELLALDYNLKSADRSAKLYQRSKFYPTVALQGSYNYSIDQESSMIPSHYYMLALNVELPLYDRGQRNINKRKAREQFSQLSYEQQNTQSLIEQNVHTILSEMITKASSIKLSGISSESAYESLELMQISYSSGATSITTLIDAQKAYIKAKQDEANAVTQFLSVTLSLQRYMNHFFSLHSENENLEYLMNLKAKIAQ